jgi:hypothetical protein
MKILNLIETLKQKGHSGIIGGYCRVVYDTEKFENLGDYLTKMSSGEEPWKDLVATFSHGIHPLGTFVLDIESFKETSFFCYLKQENKKHVFYVEIKTDDLWFNTYQFKACFNDYSTRQ